MRKHTATKDLTKHDVNWTQQLYKEQWCLSVGSLCHLEEKGSFDHSPQAFHMTLLKWTWGLVIDLRKSKLTLCFCFFFLSAGIKPIQCAPCSGLSRLKAYTPLSAGFLFSWENNRPHFTDFSHHFPDEPAAMLHWLVGKIWNYCCKYKYML